MRKTMNLWVFVAVMCLMVLAFGLVNAGIASSINEINQERANLSRQQADLKSQQDELNAQKERIGTDAFVEQEARDQYDYMMPDELRFVITFPDDSTNDPSL